MPMDFTTHEDVIRRAEQRNFRSCGEDESEDQYRIAFANFMKPIDPVEANEIRKGCGWDKWTPQLQMQYVIDKMGIADTLKMLIALDRVEESEGNGPPS